MLPPEAGRRYDLLVCDVDGTLVGEDKVVSRGVIDDVTMLEAAGMGIAVEGSPRELRAVADWVCPPPEQEGVRVVIERIFLSRSV